MSIHTVAETSPATRDAQVIAGMAAAVLASVARIHAEGLATVAALTEAAHPVRIALPPVAEAPVVAATPVVAEEPAAAEEPAGIEEPAEAELVEAQLVDAELVEAELVEAELVDEPAADVAADEAVVRITEPVWIAPQPRGRHFSEAVTDQLPAQRAA